MSSTPLFPASTDRTFPALMFLQVPEPRAGKNRWHLDFFAADPAAQVQRALELGAEKLGDFDEYGAKWTTLADPEGNVFDIGAALDDSGHLATDPSTGSGHLAIGPSTGSGHRRHSPFDRLRARRQSGCSP